MACWLFVDPLPNGVTSENVTAAFGRFGTVGRTLIFQGSRERSRHFAYVEMLVREHAEQAVKALDGSEILGKPIRVLLVNRQCQSLAAGSSVG